MDYMALVSQTNHSIPVEPHKNVTIFGKIWANMGTDGSFSQADKKPYYMANIINAGFILSFGNNE